MIAGRTRQHYRGGGDYNQYSDALTHRFQSAGGAASAAIPTFGRPIG